MQSEKKLNKDIGFPSEDLNKALEKDEKVPV